MPFLKIDDPKKREFLVGEFLRTRRNIQQSYINERVGDIDLQKDLTKFFKPVIDSQKEIVKDIVQPVTSALKPLTEGIQKAIEFPKYPSIKAYDDTAEEEKDTGVLYIGDVASKYLRQFASGQRDTDKTFGIYDKDGKFYVGNKPVEIKDNNITVGNREYQGTPGLWELLVRSNPDNNVYTKEDHDNYADILIETSAMKQKNDPSSLKPKSSRSYKWNNVIKPVWNKHIGKGLVVIPSDPKALAERLEVLMASKAAGNTGVRNEVVSICDELLRQGSISRDTYKEIMLKI
jgi:hypothetical protein